MPRNGFIDKTKYEAILDAFRAEPGNFRGCERICGIDRRSCQKAWEEGWPEKGFRPARDVIAEEEAAARARLADLRQLEAKAHIDVRSKIVEGERSRAEEDAIQSRAEEAALVRASRRSAMVLMDSVQNILRGAHTLAQRLEEQLANPEAELKPAQAMALFGAIASTTRAANEAARISQQMERSLLGEPEKWIGVSVQMSAEQALEEIEAAAEAAQRYRDSRDIIAASGIGVDSGAGTVPQLTEPH